MSNPRVAYILLWFPEPSQTFVLEEVNTLVRLGLEVRVYTLYGPRPPARIAGMAPGLAPVSHLGLPATGKLIKDLIHLNRDWGPDAGRWLRQVLCRRWRSLETAGEAFWAALAGVHLAGRFQAEGIRHIHAPWADGPATAAWVASHLSGIPFSFSARARDLHPPDGALLTKLAAASLVRTNTRANEGYLKELAPLDAAKIVNIYNGVSLAPQPAPERAWQPPFRLLALGRLVPKKGYDLLLAACRRLDQEGFAFHLTLAGDGPERHKLQQLIAQYRLQAKVTLTGFVPHREVPRLLQVRRPVPHAQPHHPFRRPGRYPQRGPGGPEPGGAGGGHRRFGPAGGHPAPGNRLAGEAFGPGSAGPGGAGGLRRPGRGPAPGLGRAGSWWPGSSTP